MDLKLTLFALRILLLFSIGGIFLLPLLVPSKEVYDKIKALTLETYLPVFLGILALGSGLLGLFQTMEGLVFLGDLLPDMTLLLLGVFLLAGFLRLAKYLDVETVLHASRLLDFFQIPLGILAWASLAAHILFPLIPLL